MRFKENHIYKNTVVMFLVLGAITYPPNMQMYNVFLIKDANIKKRKDIIDYYTNYNISLYYIVRLDSIKDIDKGFNEKNIDKVLIKDVSGYEEVNVNKDKLNKYLTIAKMTNPEIFKAIQSLDSIDDIFRRTDLLLDVENKDFVDFVVKDFNGKIKPLKIAKRLTPYRLYIGETNAFILLNKVEQKGLYVDLPTTTYLKSIEKAIIQLNIIEPSGTYYDTGVDVNFIKRLLITAPIELD